MPIKLKAKIMNSYVIPCLTYGYHTQKFNKKVKNKIITCQRGTEPSILNIKRINEIRHTKIRNLTKATNDFTQDSTPILNNASQHNFKQKKLL